MKCLVCQKELASEVFGVKRLLCSVECQEVVKTKEMPKNVSPEFKRLWILAEELIL